MKLKLSAKDRIVFGALYPPAGDLITMGIVKDLMERINLTSKEIILINLKYTENGYRWDESKAKTIGKAITFERAELALLKKRISELDNKKEITLDLIDLCKKIQELKN